MNVGQPLTILAVLGAVALSSAWEHLGSLWRALGVAAALALGLLGLALSVQPTGMGERWAARGTARDPRPEVEDD